jgi:purine-cytosine permease-like protein
MQPRVTFGPSSWILTIGAALAGIAAAVQAYTDAGGPGADYLAGLAGILAAILAILRTVQATFLAKYGETVVISEDELLDEIPAEPTDVELID